MDNQQDGRPGGLSSQATEPVPVSALRASIPDAGEVLAALAGLTRALANSDGLLDDDSVWGEFSHAINLIARIPISTTAQAIEARRAETQSGSVADESAVGNADAPNQGSHNG